MGKKLISLLPLLLVAAILAVGCELALDHFVYYHNIEEEHEKAIYQLFPDGNPEYYGCKYSEGMLIPENDDPQMVWVLSKRMSLADIMIRFSEPLTEECMIQLFYDDTGEGFIAEKNLIVTAPAQAKDVLVPLSRNDYYAIRLDINGAVPLDQIDCDASVVLYKKVPGAFRVRHCILMFVVLAALLLLIYQYQHHSGWHEAINAYGAFLASDLVWAFLVSVLTSMFFSLYYHLRDIDDLKSVVMISLHPFCVILVLTFLIVYGCMYVARNQGYSISDWLYNKRWILGMCLLFICVFFNLNVSSLHEWGNYLGNQAADGVLMGTSRVIRSDEWAKWIGFVKALGYEHYPVYSSLIRAVATENVFTTGQVACDISAVFRPFTWGFLIFGSPAYGLSFHNCGMTIVLFLFAFDFSMIICKNRKLSLGFAFAITFSPFVQWWTWASYNVVVSIFALVVAGHKYLTTESIKTKLLSAVIVFIFGGNYIMVIYPAWQVPAAYIILACLIWIFISNRSQIKLRINIDLPIIGGTVLLMLALGVGIYLRSAPAIHDMLSTVYPGPVRVNTPMSTSILYETYSNTISPYTLKYLPGPNSCEAADFITFFPLGILLCVIGMIQNKKLDSFSIIMMLLSAFFAVFSFMHVSEFMRKITFMYFSMAFRIHNWFSFVQILLLFRGVSLLKKGLKWYVSVLITALFVVLYIRKIGSPYIMGGDSALLAFLIVLLALIVWAALRAGKNERTLRTFSTIMVFFAIFSAGTINPIQRGMPEIDNSKVVKKIRSITMKDPSGKWLVDSLGFPYGTAPLLGGAPTINCSNYYPNLEMWYKLDPERDDEYAYNRYVTQINVTLIKEGDISLKVGGADDMMDAVLRPEDLEVMEVSYILTNRTLEELSTASVKFIQKAKTSGFYIYHVEYSDADEKQ